MRATVPRRVSLWRPALADKVGTHLRDYPNPVIAERVTIQHLLAHSGGTGDIFGHDYDANAARLQTIQGLVDFYGARAPLFEAGSRWGYSNFGYVLLGAVLERVTGQTYAYLVEERVFRRCGMTATSLAFASPYPGAIRYTGAAVTGRRALAAYSGLPAGGGYSTVGDLHAFIQGLRRGRLIDMRTLAEMTRPRVQAGSGHWGLGFAIGARSGVSYYGHGGGAPGINADLAVYPAYETIVLCNRGHPAAVNVVDYIGARLPAWATGAAGRPKPPEGRCQSVCDSARTLTRYPITHSTSIATLDTKSRAIQELNTGTTKTNQ